MLTITDSSIIESRGIFHSAAILVIGLVLVSCGGGNERNPAVSASDRSSAVATRAISPGAECPTGGIQVDSGIDENGNGKLDTSEIDNSETVCNGADGTDGANGLNALVNQSIEAAGNNCPFGGVRFEVGIDSNNNGLLETTEISATEFICQPQNPLADNARLDSIQLSSGSLDQVFQSSQTEYSAGIAFLTTSLRVTAFSEDENASLSINGVVTASGSASEPVELSVGGNNIDIKVIAEDGVTVRNYHISVVRQDLQAFAQRAYAKASNADIGDLFGTSVAVSGDTLVVGVPAESSNGSGINSDSQTDNSAGGSGAVYVFTLHFGVWSQQAYIKASNPDVLDSFGRSVALSGDTLAVGASSEDSNGTGINSNSQADNSVARSGAVYVFIRNGGLWSQQAYIKASNADSSDQFGFSVALTGDTLAVGAIYEGGNGTGVNSGSQADNSAANSGAVYVFTRNAGAWSQQAYIKASNTDADDEFGYRLALSGDTLAVSSAFEDSSGVGINSDSQADNSADSAGAVYVFTRNMNTWRQQAYIKASNADAADFFGQSIALSGDTLAVGASGEGSNGIGINSASQADNSARGSGAVYVFTRKAGTWRQQAYIKASNADSSDLFGISLSLSGHTLAVGASREDSNGIGVNSGSESDNSANRSGAAYVFTRLQDVWREKAYIKATNTGPEDLFGYSLALSDDTLAIGAILEASNGAGINNASQTDNSASNSGAVYVFR